MSSSGRARRFAASLTELVRLHHRAADTREVAAQEEFAAADFDALLEEVAA